MWHGGKVAMITTYLEMRRRSKHTDESDTFYIVESILDYGSDHWFRKMVLDGNIGVYERS